MTPGIAIYSLQRVSEPRKLYLHSLPTFIMLRQLPSRTLQTTLRICGRNLHCSVPLMSLGIIFGACRLALSLRRGFPPAFPEPRMLFVTTMMSIPIWGLCMSIFYLLWVLDAPSWFQGGLRDGRRRYARLAAEAIDFEADESPSPARIGFHKMSPASKWLLPPLCLGYLSCAVFGVYLLWTYELPLDHRFKEAVELANRAPRREGYGTGEKIFIAAMFYNNAAVLPYWTTEIAKVINYLGPDNVFVSILESHSTDASPTILRAFDKRLEAMGVPRRILTQDESIPRPRSMKTTPIRIEYLAALRNRAIEPLVAQGGFDRLIFSNDIFIEAESIVELLQTNDGEYDMVCSLDFGEWGLYDLWVLRDRLGRMTSTLWPYFFEETGFRGVMKDEPTPVFSCWNGITSMRTEPFLPNSLRPGRLSTSPRTHPLPPTHPLYMHAKNVTAAAAPPLRFRASAPGECFSSESFTLPYDLRRVYALEGIYVNPRVIAAYQWSYYLWFKYFMRHWAVKWFVENVENGNGMHLAKIVVGNPGEIFQWDGVECDPGPWGDS
ncbi:cryptococcal mannosyltransferase 1-domain-containing protein [Mycena metata]|uniref:Cryptococcal mannosyltransferase 1-domain-containing protein n=1 Tax=Mycena metata TaxID=1033252 RepID=A0AAD7MQY8_9AGAR|nr:cryptococcal mannosyltransferase 1-domain-containing protein [Mycena metata]